MDDKNKKSDEVTFKITSDSDIEKAIEQLKKMKETNNKIFSEYESKNTNDLYSDEYFEKLKKSYFDSNFESSFGSENNDNQNNDNNTSNLLDEQYSENVYDSGNRKKVMMEKIISLKKFSNFYFFLLLIQYIIGIVIFIAYYFTKPIYFNGPLEFRFLHTVQSDSTLIIILVVFFVLNVIPFVFVPIVILSSLNSNDLKIKNRKELKVLFIIGIFTGLVGLVASGILSFSVLKGVKISKNAYQNFY
ncbi:MAG: hypothetical protein K2H56_01775 [Malacoplasma sp.]|nr:hypothetical protein [Malacoplasma sp.]MDE5775183.1 hypothetical protein [Malacoplasma sp.]